MKTPFTILTGYLGAGKTSILNRMLAEPAGKRIAVLVNELGKISIDTKRIVHDGGDVIELSGGCVCCKIDVRSDLVGGIGDIIERSKPDHVVLETTGIANPQILVSKLGESGELPIELAGVVCVVDSTAFSNHLTRWDEVALQAEEADSFVISKTDICTAEQHSDTRRKLAELNPSAIQAAFPVGQDGDALLTEWICSRVRRKRTRKPRHSHSQLTAVSFSAEGTFSQQGVVDVLESLRPKLVRVKGDVRVERGGVRIDYAGDTLTVASQNPPDVSELVLIGEGIESSEIHPMLWAARLGGELRKD